MAATTMSTTSLLSTRSPVPVTRRFTSRPARAVRVFASSQEKRDQGPKDAVLKTFGAFAAAQLAILPIAGGAIADIIPNKAERAEVNERTSNLPTFSDVGQSLKQNLGQNNPKDIGRAIDRNTPDVDLTKNPKDIGKDIKRGVEKVTPNLPDLSEAPSPVDTAASQRDQVVRKGSDVTQDVGKALSGNPAQKVLDKAQSVGSDVVNKAKNVTSDLSDLPNPFKGNADPQNLANDAKNKAKNLGNQIGKNVPTKDDVDRAANKAQGLGNKAANKAKNVASDLSDLPNPFKGNTDPQNLANDAKNKAKNLGDQVGKNVPTKDDVERFGNKLDKNTPNLPNLGGGNLPGSGQSKGGLGLGRNT